MQMAASDLVRARHRALRSDFLLVKSPETDALVPFRDVIEVDGVQVRDREARLAKLFLNATPTSVDGWRAMRCPDVAPLPCEMVSLLPGGEPSPPSLTRSHPKPVVPRGALHPSGWVA